MEPLLIPCPNCGKELKLPDRKLLGRKAKCRSCEHRFILEEPDEVELQLADDAPAVGTAAEWVPDDAPANVPAATAAAIPQIAVDDDRPRTAVGPRDRAANRRKQRQKKLWMTVGSAVSALLIALIVFAIGRSGGRPAATGNGEANGRNGAKSPGGNDRSRAIAGDDEDREPEQPKPEGAIDLTGIPTGAHVVISLRPAELWKSNSDAETVMLCLGGLYPWTQSKLKELLLFDPHEIEEAVVCLYMYNKAAPPEVAYRVKLVERQKPSTFYEKFGGKRDTETGRRMYLTEGTPEKPARVYTITDRVGESFASAPASMKDELLLAMDQPGFPSGSLEQLLPRTDRSRHVTVLFSPAEMRDFKEQLFPESVHPLLERFLDRFEDTKIEGAAWSLYFGGPRYDDLYSEILLRNTTSSSPRQLRTDMQRKFESLPDDVAGLVQKMQPKLVSEQKLVSRLPIMLKAFEVETVTTTGTDNDRYVKLTTVLPKIAGPNLAAAGTLAWRLATTTDFSKPAKPQPTSPKIPELVADRLRMPIEVDFRQLPLQEAYEFIGQETSVKVTFDDGALENGGITKNKPLSFKLGKVPATAALQKIASEFTGPNRNIVVVVNEQEKSILITTKVFAEKNNQKPHPLDP